jgi:polyhydroxybutyrate depolymerase
MGIEAQENALQFFYAAPDGTTNPAGLEFWNATDACCNFYGSTVDDVAYLTAVIQDMQARYPIDPKRIFIVGHSNGGFMAHRMACDRASMIAAILSLAGAQWENPANCAPSEPVTVVELHGTADTTIAYGGGTIAQGDGGLVAFPSAPQTVATWASKNGCSTVITDAGPTYNFDQLIPGNQTTVERYSDCPMGDVELWSILGGPHIPDLGGDWPGAPLGFLLAHPKP